MADHRQGQGKVGSFAQAIRNANTLFKLLTPESCWCSYTTGRILANQDKQKGKRSWCIAQIRAPRKNLEFTASKIGSGALL